MIPKRPLLIYVPVIIFVIGAIVSAAGVTGILQSWNWVEVYSSSALLIYGIFKNAFLALACSTAAVLLWMRLNWSVTYCTVLSVVTAVWFWIDRTVLTQNPMPFNRHLLPLIITLVLLISTLISLYFVDPYMHQALIQNLESDEKNHGL